MKYQMEKVDLLEKLLGGIATVKGAILFDAPLHITQLFDILLLGIGKPEEFEIVLLTPKRELPFEQIMRAVRFVAKRGAPIPVLVADDINPKFRPLLVREKIPFIYRDKTIFIPKIGLKGDFGKMFKIQPKQELRLKDVQFELKPLALKIIAGYLTNEIPKSFAQGHLYEEISHQTRISRSKFSEAIRNLLEAEILSSKGLGPNKSYQFTEKQELWRTINKLPIGKLFRVVEGEAPKIKSNYIVAGETALANFSNLAEPKKKRIAVTSATFKNIKKSDQEPQNSRNQNVVIEVWKEDPKLFAIRNNLNPIELYFSLRRDMDDRVQISLQDMLREYDIEMENR